MPPPAAADEHAIAAGTADPAVAEAATAGTSRPSDRTADATATGAATESAQSTWPAGAEQTRVAAAAAVAARTETVGVGEAADSTSSPGANN